MKGVKYVARLLQYLQMVLQNWTGKSIVYTLQFGVIEVVDMNTHSRKESSCFLKREGTNRMHYFSLRFYEVYLCFQNIFYFQGLSNSLYEAKLSSYRSSCG